MKNIHKYGTFILLLTMLITISIFSACSFGEAPIADYSFIPEEFYYVNSDGEEVPVKISADGELINNRSVPKDGIINYRSTIKYDNGENIREIKFDTGIGVIEPTECGRKGKFAYWYAISDGSEIELSDADGKFFLASELPTYLGKVERIFAKTYTPIAVNNGNDNTKATDVAYYGDDFRLPENLRTAAKRDHYDVAGYSADISDKVVRLDAQGSISGESSDEWLIDTADEVVFNVEYTPHTYTLSLSSNSTDSDVSELPSELTHRIVYGASMPNLRVPKRTGHVFDGWQCVKDGQSVAITDEHAAYYNNFTTLNDNYLFVGEEVHLQPKWQKAQYKLRYFADEDTAPEEKSVEYNAPLSAHLPSEALQIEGYDLSWRRANGTEVNLATTTMPASGLDLYAVYTKSTNKLLLYGNGGITGTGAEIAEQSIEYAATSAIRQNPFTRTGYSFDCWSVSISVAGQTYADGAEYTMGASAENKLYAIWSANTYTVSFNAGGATSGTAMNNLSAVMDRPIQKLPLNTYRHTEKTFKGWAWSAASQTADYLDGAGFVVNAEIVEAYAGESGLLTLYAVWGAPCTVISFDRNGGTVVYGESAMSKQTIMESSPSKVLYKNTYEKTEYRFGGWLRPSDQRLFYDCAPYALTTEAEVTLIAQWLRLYTVNYESGGGNGIAPATSKYVAGESFTLPQNPFTNSQYDFAGWSNGERTYAAGGTYEMVDANVTFTAVWNLCAVTYSGGQGAVGTDIPKTNRNPGDRFNLANNPYQKEGCSFIGWSDGTTTYPAGASYVMPSGSATFSAVWYEREGFTPVWTVAQLDAVRNNLTGNYVLAKDLDLGGVEWSPIGTGEGELAFSGVFDGGGHVIDNLVISYATDYAALFGYVTGTVCKLGVINTDILIDNAASTYAGALAGYSKGTISDCYSTGSIAVRVTVDKNWSVLGGLTGCSDGMLTQCYSAVNVNAVSSTGSACSGGLVGGGGGTVNSSFATGKVEATGSYLCIGGLVGTAICTVTNSFYAGFGFTAGLGEVATAEDLAQEDWYIDVTEFSTDVWTLTPGYYPSLKYSGAAPISMPTTSPIGSVGNPIAISTVAQLKAARMERSYLLTADIDLQGASWTPLGYDDAEYTGRFDGGGHTISNLHIVVPNNTGSTAVPLSDGECSLSTGYSVAYYGAEYLYGGLFSRVCGAIVNLGIVNCTGAELEGGSSGGTFLSDGLLAVTPVAIKSNIISVVTGAVVGELRGVVANCYATGSFSDNDMVGGLVGRLSGTITNSYASVSISYCGEAGGLVGYMESGRINNCYSTANVSSGANSGGLVGHIWSGTIQNSFATGNVTANGSCEANSYVGGLIGKKETATVTNCYRSSSQVLTRYGSNGYSNDLGTATSAANLQSESFLRSNLGFGKYVSAENLAANPANVWVFGGAAPRLYFQN